MGKPARRALLPGIDDSGCPPEVVVESRRVIASARRRAAIRDAFDCLFLACVDGLFVRWPRAHLPLFDRRATMLLLAGANVLMLLWIWSARSLPRWRARRVASTWNRVERNQLIDRYKY